jgi:alkylglycerol monooxygenase
VFSVWIWFQLLVLLAFVSYLFGNIAPIGSPSIFLYGVFIFLFVYSYTEQMDQSKQAWIWDLLKTVFGLTILIQTGDWFGAKAAIPQAPWIVGSYLVISSFACWYFTATESKHLANKVSV